MKHKIEYEVYPNGYKHVKSVDGFWIADDKCAYECMKCGAIFMSKNISCRSVFPSDDPRYITCDKAKHTIEDLKRICECKEIIIR